MTKDEWSLLSFVLGPLSDHLKGERFYGVRWHWQNLAG